MDKKAEKKLVKLPKSVLEGDGESEANYDNYRL